MKNGSLAVISGFSGVGKGTLVKELIKNNDDFALSVSATTRKPREGEEDGKHYFFITREQFEQDIRDGKFLEYTRYLDNYYGTPKDYVMSQLEKGRNIILEIEMEGALNVKKVFPQAKLIFVTAPNEEEIRARLKARGTESDEEIEARIERSHEERSYMDKYDYILENDDFDKALSELKEIIKK